MNWGHSILRPSRIQIQRLSTGYLLGTLASRQSLDYAAHETGCVPLGLDDC